MDKNDFGITIVATPIGNLEDMSQRAIDTIKVSDFIICENPKHSLKLLNKFGIKKKLVSLHDYNENAVIQRLLVELDKKNIVLISDAGSPLVCDPGFKLIKHCIENNIKVSAIPGPNAIIPALQLSGVPMNEFYFTGFYPKTKNSMEEFVNNIRNSKATSVFFVSNHKLQACLSMLEEKIPKRKVSVSKEISKINERTYRGLGGDLKNLIFGDLNQQRGEFVVVVEGNSLEKTKSIDIGDYNKEIKKLLSKFSLTDVVEIVHKLTKIRKNKLYKWVLNLKKL